MTRKDELRNLVDYPSDAHTRLKHTFYRRYIACWMGKILQGRFGSEATIVEGFSGSGQYSDGLDGSALMIATLYRDHIHSANFQHLRFVTNDLDPRRTSALNQRLIELPDEPRLEHAPLSPSKFEDITGLLQSTHSPNGRQTLWIIDPLGLKAIPWSAVEQCARRPKNDVIITLMVDELHRYRTNPVMDGLMTATLGGDEWKSLSPSLTTAESKAAVIALYRKRLKDLGCLTQSFDIEVRGRKARYSLIFATHHEAGLKCFNDARWSADTASGKGASASTGFEATLFEPDKSELEDAFEQLSGTYSFDDLSRRASILGFKDTHLRAILDALFDEGRAFRLTPATSPTNSPWPSGATIRLYASDEIERQEVDLDDD
ncbi:MULTISPECIES: three-Cys-motif partner protein TcmP [unclassified Mycobacterium]|uniref:three-Cys-motif partner protein TcmP n=1 Tax=unclassified Mycobacterium TaxID=2642494 RepID=UPI0029C99CA5|nr:MULTISPECIES: three-Cys-motif partner protein TcmP [unclassified Mycobacterium]